MDLEEALLQGGKGFCALCALCSAITVRRPDLAVQQAADIAGILNITVGWRRGMIVTTQHSPRIGRNDARLPGFQIVHVEHRLKLHRPVHRSESSRALKQIYFQSEVILNADCLALAIKLVFARHRAADAAGGWHTLEFR